MNGVEPGAPLVNRTFDELCIGETASLVRLANPDDIKLFAAVSGDVNPAHLDAQYVRRAGQAGGRAPPGGRRRALNGSNRLPPNLGSLDTPHWGWGL
jgi:acyl dehydratase